MNASEERRYNNQQWKRVRLSVLQRDGWRCKVTPSCPTPATVVDHIMPVYRGMPDWEFYDPLNLRASCKRHNTARGVADRLRREMGGEDVPAVRSRFSFGQARKASVF